MREKEKAVVVSQEYIGTGIYSMVIKTKAADSAVAGQFVSIYCKDKTKLLPRPISICEIDKENGTIRIVYRVVGGGTEEMSGYKSGDGIELIGPLGNGFMQRENKKAILIGGGIGIPPMVGLAEALKDKGIQGDVIYACGPTPMLKAIKEYAMEKGIECQLSLEERMACGIGACLACVCKSKDKDAHSNVNNKRICKDGPVFWAEEVEL